MGRLNYKELSAKYKEMSLKYAQGRAQIVRLKKQVKGFDVPAIGKMQGRIEELVAVVDNRDSLLVTQATHLGKLNKQIGTLDDLMTEARPKLQQAAQTIIDQENKIDELKSQYKDIHQVWSDSSRKEAQHDDHWRELTDYIYRNVGQVSNLLDLITNGVGTIGSKYKS